MCYGRWICTNIPGHTSSQIVLQSKVSVFFFLCQNLDIIDKIGSDWNIFISVILSFFNKKRVLDIHVKSWSNVLPGEQVSTNIS